MEGFRDDLAKGFRHAFSHPDIIRHIYRRHGVPVGLLGGTGSVLLAYGATSLPPGMMISPHAYTAVFLSMTLLIGAAAISAAGLRGAEAAQTGRVLPVVVIRNGFESVLDQKQPARTRAAADGKRECPKNLLRAAETKVGDYDVRPQAEKAHAPDDNRSRNQPDHSHRSYAFFLHPLELAWLFGRRKAGPGSASGARDDAEAQDT